jgi:hypothetical protein
MGSPDIQIEALRWLLTSHQRRMLTAETLQHCEDEQNEEEDE